MTVADGFFFGIGLMGSVLVLIIFLLIVTLIAAFISYLTDKNRKTRTRTEKRDGDDRTDDRW